MMRQSFLALLFVALSVSGFPQETKEARRCRRGQAAGYATRDATVLSMMGWGVGLAVGIATLCALVDDNSSSSSSSGGNTSH